MKNRRLLLYVDGGARGNPGPAGIGIVISDGKKTLKELYKYIGQTTNNIAEYNALIYGLEEARGLKADDVIVYLDSELVTKQLNGEYRVRDNEMRILFKRAADILKDFKSFEIRHIDRSKNKEADRLVNKAINLSSLF